MTFDLKNIAAFGVAGNFTGHLEQAGEAVDFANVVTAEENAPKAVFPTYIPVKSEACPEFLNIFPFDYERIIYPEGQTKLQIEPECALIFDVCWEENRVKKLVPLAFGASNDCSIRREGAKKISVKKNWGNSSKGFSASPIMTDSFDSSSIINDYRIASFLVRDGKAYAYGEDSAVKDYSYVYEKLTDWIIDKLNNQKDEGPAENINQYLNGAGCPEKILVSIGATRYTEFGENNFLKNGDRSVVILYPGSVYTPEQISEMAETRTYNKADISVLDQKVTAVKAEFEIKFTSADSSEKNPVEAVSKFVLNISEYLKKGSKGELKYNVISMKADNTAVTFRFAVRGEYADEFEMLIKHIRKSAISISAEYYSECEITEHS